MPGVMRLGRPVNREEDRAVKRQQLRAIIATGTVSSVWHLDPTWAGISPPVQPWRSLLGCHVLISPVSAEEGTTLLQFYASHLSITWCYFAPVFLSVVIGGEYSSFFNIVFESELEISKTMTIMGMTIMGMTREHKLGKREWTTNVCM